MVKITETFGSQAKSDEIRLPTVSGFLDELAKVIEPLYSNGIYRAYYMYSTHDPNSIRESTNYDFFDIYGEDFFEYLAEKAYPNSKPSQVVEHADYASMTIIPPDEKIIIGAKRLHYNNRGMPDKLCVCILNEKTNPYLIEPLTRFGERCKLDEIILQHGL